MRPVNLLPQRYRPRTAGSGDPRSAYIALGVLGILVLAMFGYVMAANSVSSRNSEIADARQQIAAANSQSVTFQEFGDFASVKEARLSAVRTLATSRLDWERLFRELAHVLPEGVWLTGFDGHSAAPSTGVQVGLADTATNTLTLNGCADDHRQVANVMIRLRELNVAQDVELTKTEAPAKEESVPGAAAATAASGGGSDNGCGRFHSFEIAVTLAAPGGGVETTDPVPASLGGGS